MHIQTFIGTGGDIQWAVEAAEKQAEDLLNRLSASELFDVKVNSSSDQNGYVHIITVVYE